MVLKFYSVFQSPQFRKIVVDHLLSILLVSILFVLFMIIVDVKPNEDVNDIISTHQLVDIKSLNIKDTLHIDLLIETVKVFFPKYSFNVDSLVRVIEQQRIEKFSNEQYKKGSLSKRISFAEVQNIILMYIKFAFLFVIIMALSYYATNTLAIYYFIERKREIKNKQRLGEILFSIFRSDLNSIEKIDALLKGALLIIRNIFILIVALILFSPAYVIAYSLKTSFETGSYVFIIALGIISNGLLINYAYKFYTYLVHESRKGYVETAIVKGLNRSYEYNTSEGISIKSLFKINKKFHGHILQHIYHNAQYQYIGAMKQYTSFMITGLIIIEMALNIQGHLGYELLKDILYKRYQSALFIIFLIFILVKVIEFIIDLWSLHQSKKYER